MSPPAAVPPAHAATNRYRLIRHDNGDWSLRYDGVERCRWNATWPPAAIKQITALAVHAETRRPIVWLRLKFACRSVVYLPVAAPARDIRPRGSTGTGPRRPRPRPAPPSPA